MREPYQTDPEKDSGPREEFGVTKNDLGEEVVKQEFQDHEILAAFNFIDLDHNNFIGAREIRHILVCMGEMITDEEIDCMISMVDMDGDGQVSYMEFGLWCHPDQGSWTCKAVNAEKDTAINKERQAEQAKTKPQIYRLSASEELTAREAKKKSIIDFPQRMRLLCNQQAYQNFLDLPAKRDLVDAFNFLCFVNALELNPLLRTSYYSICLITRKWETWTLGSCC